MNIRKAESNTICKLVVKKELSYAFLMFLLYHTKNTLCKKPDYFLKFFLTLFQKTGEKSY